MSLWSSKLETALKYSGSCSRYSQPQAFGELVDEMFTGGIMTLMLKRFLEVGFDFVEGFNGLSPTWY